MATGFDDHMADMRNGVPMFDRSGAVLSPEERANIARRKGICQRCGRKTHKVTVFRREALTNTNVYNGICLVCNPDKRPTASISPVVDSARPNQPSLYAGGGGGTHRMRQVAAAVALTHVPQHRAPPTASSGSGTTDRSSRPSSSRVPSSVQRMDNGYESDDSLDVDTAVQRPGSLSRIGQDRSIGALGTSDRSRAVVNNASSTNTSNHSSNHASRAGLVRITEGQDSSVEVATRGSLESSLVFDEYEEQRGVRTSDDAWDVVKAMRDNPRDATLLRQKCHQLRNIGDNQAGSIYEVKDIMCRHSRNPKLLAAACGAVWSTTAENDDKKVEAADTGCIEILVGTLRSVPGDAHLAQWVCGCLASLAGGLGNKKEIADAGGIRVLVDALKNHRGSAGVFEWACRALYSLVDVTDTEEADDENKKENERTVRENVVTMEEAGAIPEILKSMNEHSAEVIAQEWAFRLLWRLLDRDDEASSNRISKKIKDEGGATACVQALKTKSASPILREMSSVLLFNLLEGADTDSSAYRLAAGCLSSIVKAMKNDLSNEVLTESSCNLLLSLSLSSDENKLSIHQCGGISVVVNAMRTFPANSSIHETGCWILWSLSTKTFYIDSAPFREAVQAVNDSVRAHSSSTVLLAAACGFWANCATSPNADVGAVPLEVVSRGLSSNPPDSLFQQQACRAVTNLCLSDPNMADVFVAVDGISALIKAMGSSCLKVQEEACGALLVLSASSESNRNSVVSSGGIEMITDAIRMNPTATSFQVSALNMLSVLAMSIGKEARYIPDNIIDVVTQCMDMHPKSTAMQVSACTAIRNVLLAPASRQKFRSLDVLINTMLQTMRTLQHEASLQKEACGVLWSIAGMPVTESPEILTSMFRAVLETMNLFNGEDYPFDADLQSEALGALEVITALFDECPVTLTPRDLDIVLSIMYRTLEYDPDRIDVYVKVLGVVYNLTKVAENENTIVQCGGIVAVIDAMVENEGLEVVQEKGCSVLSHLSTENLEVKLCIAETDGVDMLISAMVGFPSNRRIQIEACSTLSHLSVDRESRILIASQGGIMLIVSAMKNHLNDVELQEKACSALCNLASDANERVLSEADVVNAVISSMRSHPDVAKVQEKGLGVLQNLSMRNSSTKMIIGANGGIEVIMTAIRENLAVPAVLERAFTTMWSLAVLDKNQVRIAEAGGIRLVVNGMMANITVEKVQKQACGCLCTLSSHPGNKAKIKAEGGIDAIVFAMWAHLNSETLQTEACRALSSLAVGAQASEITVVSDSEVNAILTAMRSFPNSAKLQEHSCLALRNFSLSQENAAVMRRNSEEIQELLGKAAARFPRQCSERANQVLAQII